MNSRLGKLNEYPVENNTTQDNLTLDAGKW